MAGDADEEAIVTAAQQAVADKVGGSLCFLLPGRRGEIPESAGSGVLIRTRRDHLVVLTAKHVAEDAASQEIRLGYIQCGNTLSDFVRGMELHPDPAVDVGLLGVKPSYELILRSLAESIDDVAEDDRVIVEGDWLVLTGFPAEFIKKQRFEYGFTSVCYTTGLTDPPRDESGRFRIEWSERVTPFGAVPMPHPGGISGGALWRFRPVRSDDELWSPTSRGRLIGIPCSWDCVRTQFAEPTSRWRDWFLEKIEVLDEHLSSAT